MKKEKNDKLQFQSKKAIIWLVVAIAICAVVATYAAYQYAKRGTQTHQLQTGQLILEMDDATANGIEIDPAKPLTEGEGLDGQAYQFVLRNTGTGAASYRISLVDDEEAYEEDDCSENKMPHSALKVALSKDGGEEDIKLLSESDEIGYLDSGDIGTDDGDITYTLKLWMDEGAGNEVQGTHFHGKIKLEGIVKGRNNFETGE